MPRGSAERPWPLNPRSWHAAPRQGVLLSIRGHSTLDRGTGCTELADEASGGPARRRLARRIDGDECGRSGAVADDGLAGVEHVEIAALDRGLRLELARPGSRRHLD